MSNRAPFEPTGKGRFKKGAGGLVTALLTVAESTGAQWVACARSDRERQLAEEHGGRVEVGEEGDRIGIHYAAVDPDRYYMYYSVISNPLLWFIQHYLWNLSTEPVIDDQIHRAWQEGYVEVNHQIARTAIKLAKKSVKRPLVLTQDYQLYLAPRFIRDAVPDATLQQFVHIPWPTPQYWKILPQGIRDAIVDGLLANDVVGFQSSLDVRNFLITCEENMGIRVDHRERAVLYKGTVVWVRSYPISVDVAALEQQATSGQVRKEEAEIERWRPKHLIVRVDRTDPSKNIVRGFLAYERMLRSHPELAGKVQFWAFLQPSRQDVPVYRDYLRQIRGTARRINSELGRRRWLPIRLELGENMHKAIAAYRNFDVLLVNPIYDGMNLVAKEGMLVNHRNGVLVLSENAGSHEELGEHAVTVNPFDVDLTAQALHQALLMSKKERVNRGETLRHIIRANDINRWVSLQIRDLRDLVQPPSAQEG